MANDLNQWQGIGRLGKDPESKSMPSGKAVVNFSIACGESWKDKETGDKKEKTEWVNIVAFDKLAEIIAKYLTKGSQVYISGKLTTRKWQDKEGRDRYTTEVVADKMQMLGGRPGAKPDVNAHNEAKANGYQPQADAGGFEDDIPFAQFERGSIV